MSTKLSVSIPVQIINLVGESHFAVAELGGITVRGRKAADPLGAIQNLLWELANTDHRNDDAEMALELLLSGTTIGDQLAIDAPQT